MKWTLPNILTLLRLAAAPSVPIIILYFQQPLSYLIALAIFILAGMLPSVFTRQRNPISMVAGNCLNFSPFNECKARVKNLGFF